MLNSIKHQKHPTLGGSNITDKAFPISDTTGESTNASGSGGDYLSDEIMYRATRKREETGHHTKQIERVHISNNLSVNTYLNVLTKIFQNAVQKVVI